MSLKPKVAHVVSDQIPDVFVDSYLHKFLTAYYQFMEQSGVSGALDYSRNVLEYKDIDTAPDYIVKEVVYTLLNNYKQLNVEPRLLVKNLKEIFSNKGNERSYKFLMQALFGEEAALAWGRDQVFKASAFKYDQDVVMLLAVPDIDVPYPNEWNLNGNVIFKEKTATTSHATAVVDSTTVITQNGKQYFRLTLVPHTVHGNFYPDDYITCECRNNGKFASTIKGQHGNLEIINSGTLYKPGDLLKFVGAEGAGYITEVTGGPVDSVSIINPGLGYSTDDSIVIEHELGNGFDAKIEAVDGVDAIASPNMKLEELYINDGGFGYQVGDVVTIDCGVPFTTTVSLVSDVSPFAENVLISEMGSDYLSGYRLGAYTLDGTGTVSSYTELKTSKVELGQIKLNNIYNIPATSQLAINGQLGEAWVSDVSSGQATVSVKPGINYVDPVISVSRYDVASLNTIVDLNATFGLASVTVVSSRNFTTVSDTVDFVVGNKFCTTNNPEKYAIGYGVKIDSFSARVTGISGNTISLNIACTATGTGVVCSVFPHPLTVSDTGTGAAGTILFNSGAVQELRIPDFVTNKIGDCIVTGGSGTGLSVSPYFNVDSITVDNPGSQYAESILRYDVISITTGNTSFLTTRSEKYEVGAKISFGYHVTTVTGVDGNQVSFEDAAPVDYTGTVSIRVFKPAIDVIISDGHGSGAELAFVVQNGVISSIDSAFIAGGSAYTYATIKDAETNVGSGAILQAIISAGTITGYTVIDGGHDYTTGDYFVVTGDGTSATIPAGSVVTADQAIRKVYVKNAGSGYYPECKLNAIPAGFSVGTPATFDVTIDNGSITGVTVVDQGAGYDVDNLSFVFEGDGYDAAVSGVTIVAGKITGVTTGTTGFGYTYATLKAVRGNVANLKTVVKDGKIVSVDVIACGSGYASVPEYEILPDTNWMPPDPGIMEYTFPMMDFYRLFPEPIGYSRIATASADVSRGAIKAVEITYPGEGYYHIEKPMSLTVVGNGSGAVLWPIVDIWATDSNGLPIRKLKDIKVLDQGQGYDDATKIIVNRGGCPAGADAQLTPVIVNGKIVSVHIDAFGTNYYTGTKVYIKGNGQDATVKATINSGIHEVHLTEFSFVGAKPIPVIHDAYGSGADIVANWDGDHLVGFTVNAPGSGYTSPVITIGSGPTVGVFQCKTFGTIDAIDVINPGFDYTNADCVILCDSGFSATTNVLFSTLREVSSVTVHNHGFRYGKVPKVTLIDKSGSGRISKVKILDHGAGYKRLPKITVPSVNATEQALLVAYGSNIGGVSKVQLTDFGIDIDSDTVVTGSINVINKEINRYVQGEPVINRDLFYTESDYSDGPTGTLSEIDNATAYIKIKLPPIKVSIETEDGYVLFGDDGELMIEGAEDFGKNWKAAYSQVSLDPMIVDRFEGRFQPTAIAYHAPKLSRSNSVLNTNIRLTNSRNIQDFAYTVKTGVDIKFWRDIVKQMIHPSGYGMYGQIVDQNLIKRSVKSIAKDESGIIQDIIWLFINLSDDDSMARVPVRDLYEYFIVEWNKLIQLLMKNESYVSVVHASINDMALTYAAKFGVIEWANTVSERNHTFKNLTSNGFKAWYPYECLNSFTNTDGYYVPNAYWTSANTGIVQFKDMSIQDYITNNNVTNMQADSFILIKHIA